jgi:transglutaminase-like putative cysteine protease/uncharacterized protein (DUF58 family)
VRSLARRFRLPRHLRVPFAGRAFLLVTLGVGVAAVNTGNNLLYLALSLNLSLILLSGILSEGTLRRVTLKVRLASEAFAGGEAFLAVTCSTGAKRFPGISLVAVLRAGEDPVTVRFPDIAPGTSVTRVVRFRPARRGKLDSISASVSTRFPFSLFEKSVELAIPAGVIVYPRPSPPPARRVDLPVVAPSGRPFLSGRVGAFPRGVREHLPADPVRDIHWRTTARTGRWMVKEREGEAAPGVDLRVEESGMPEAFEARLSEACGAVLELDRRAVPFRLRIGDRLCAEAHDPGRRSKALEALATAPSIPATSTIDRQGWPGALTPMDGHASRKPMDGRKGPEAMVGGAADAQGWASVAGATGGGSDRLPTREFLWWSLRAHWALALVLLALFTDAARWALLLAAVAWAAGVAMDRADTPRAALSRVGTPIVALFLAAAAADFLIGSRDLLVSLSLLVLGVQSVKFLLPKGSRDGWQLCAVALLEFLAAAAGTDAMAFALFAFLFFVASAGAMGALQDQEAEEAGRPSGGYAVPARAAAAVLLVAGVGGFLASAVLFAVIPRLAFRQVLEPFGRARGVVGFSETITLGEVTGIKSDRRVVARVEFPELRPGLLPVNLYLRGAVYSRYEDGVWRHGGGTPVPLQRAGFQHFPGFASAPDSTADITLEAAAHPTLFIYGQPTLIEGAFAPLLSDGEGNLSLARSGHPTLRYRVRFAADLPPGKGMRHRPGGVHTAFPREYEDVRALAQEIAGGTGTDDERAKRIVRFFGSGFRYTVSDPAASLREFLFRKRAGYCEHFATGLSLLLRGAGIPSRVAAGYLGGEWNGWGEYLIVRQSDAHAWVEAWIDGRWVTLDATPSFGDSSPFRTRTGTISLYADWLRQRWDKYVVNYSLRMQADAVKEGVRAVRRTGTAFRFRGWDGIGGTAPRAAGWAILAAPALYLLRRLLRKRRNSAGKESPAFLSPLPGPYARLVRRLDRNRFRRDPGETLEETLAAAVRSHPDLSEDAARFLGLYHRERFGPTPLLPDTREEAFRLANRLGRAISNTPRLQPPTDLYGEGYGGKKSL